MGDGGTIPNLGQKSLDLSDDDGNNAKSVLQIAAFTRPLMSVGRNCDEGHNITFDAVMAVVRDTHGTEFCQIHSQQGGMYAANMELRKPKVLLGSLAIFNASMPITRVIGFALKLPKLISDTSKTNGFAWNPLIVASQHINNFDVMFCLYNH